MTLTNKQIKLLGILAVKPVVAPWANPVMFNLNKMGLVTGEIAADVNGKVHTSKVWTLTDAGKRFVAESVGA